MLCQQYPFLKTSALTWTLFFYLLYALLLLNTLSAHTKCPRKDDVWFWCHFVRLFCFPCSLWHMQPLPVLLSSLWPVWLLHFGLLLGLESLPVNILFVYGKALERKGNHFMSGNVAKSWDGWKMKQFLDVITPRYYLFVWKVSVRRCSQGINSFVCEQQRPKPLHKTTNVCIFPSILHRPNVSHASLCHWSIWSEQILFV